MKLAPAFPFTETADARSAPHRETWRTSLPKAGTPSSRLLIIAVLVPINTLFKIDPGSRVYRVLDPVVL